ncbi:MAG: sulfotransferase family protein [Candidatus Thermoplasmatota archaeon]|nr:sulfotransferase family protein [Candidatus Thermoplasmatota archaeon]
MGRDYITVVTGLPRSGTSLMMSMLDKGGIAPLKDDVRTADVDNPKGYYEFERVKKLPGDQGWLPEARGRAVKVLGELMKHLPSGFEYRVVFMMRDLDEIVSSQKKMMIRRGEDPDVIPDDELIRLYRTYLKNLKGLVNSSENMRVAYINYNELLSDPDQSFEEIRDLFDGDIDADSMRDAIDLSLYRNRGG